MRKKGNVSEFKHIMVERLHSVKGGCLKKAEVVKTLEVEHNDVNTVYVHMSANYDWLCRAVTGEGRADHPLARVALLDMLRQGLRKAAAPNPAEADDDADVVLEALALSDSENEGTGAKPKTKKRKVSTYTRKLNTQFILEMHEHCLEVFPEKAATMRQVRLWALNRRELWIHVDDLPWALEYMHHQRSVGGIGQLPSSRSPTSSGPSRSPTSADSPQASDSSHRSVEWPVWDWETSSWKAERRWADGARRIRLLKPEHLTIDDAMAVAEDRDIRTLEGLDYSSKTCQKRSWHAGQAEPELQAVACVRYLLSSP